MSEQLSLFPELGLKDTPVKTSMSKEELLKYMEDWLEEIQNENFDVNGNVISDNCIDRVEAELDMLEHLIGKFKS